MNNCHLMYGELKFKSCLPLLYSLLRSVNSKISKGLVLGAILWSRSARKACLLSHFSCKFERNLYILNCMLAKCNIS